MACLPSIPDDLADDSALSPEVRLQRALERESIWKEALLTQERVDSTAVRHVYCEWLKRGEDRLEDALRQIALEAQDVDSPMEASFTVEGEYRECRRTPAHYSARERSHRSFSNSVKCPPHVEADKEAGRLGPRIPQLALARIPAVSPRQLTASSTGSASARSGSASAHIQYPSTRRPQKPTFVPKLQLGHGLGNTATTSSSVSGRALETPSSFSASSDRTCPDRTTPVLPDDSMSNSPVVNGRGPHVPALHLSGINSSITSPIVNGSYRSSSQSPTPRNRQYPGDRGSESRHYVASACDRQRCSPVNSSVQTARLTRRTSGEMQCWSARSAPDLRGEIASPVHGKLQSSPL